MKCTASGTVKSRAYSIEYLKFGFITSRVDDTRPECIFCGEILCNDTMKPSKPKRHQGTKLTQDLQFFERQKRLYLDKRPATIESAFSRQNSVLEKASEVSYCVSFNIAKAKKPHNIGEELIKPSCVKKWYP